MIENLKHKERIESKGFTYLGTYESKEIMKDTNEPRPRSVYVRVICNYCKNEYDVTLASFNGAVECKHCCGSYEKSLAYCIEVGLGKSLEEFWDYEHNEVDPRYISRDRSTKVLIKDYKIAIKDFCHMVDILKDILKDTKEDREENKEENTEDIVEEVEEKPKKPNYGYICDGIKASNVEVLHKQGFYGKGLKVGIIDTGIYSGHKFIEENILCAKNFTTSDAEAYIDENNHGTFIASEIVQIAPECKLVIAKSLDKKGNGTFESVINGFRYCIDQGVDCINMSLGCPYGDERLHNLIKEANSKGIAVFTAGGNEGDLNPETDENSYPGSYEESINIEAVDINGKVPNFSNSNKYIDAVCVGVDIIGAYLNNKWCVSSGSSMAAPIACGIAILLKERFIKKYGRKPSESELFNELINNTKDLSIDKRQQGHGFVYVKES